LKSFKRIVYIAICSFTWHCCNYIQPMAYAEYSLGEAIDCTDVTVDYLENSTLTKEERIQLMDKAFFQSLNKFELCQEAKKMAGAAGGGNVGGGNVGGGTSNGGAAGGSGGDAGDVAGKDGGMSASDSVASSTMSGTQVPPKDSAAEGGEAEESGALQSSQDVAENGSKTGGDKQRSNGKLPDDIPPAKNDDALAAQIRYAAENETDPVKSKQLWNEYRKYKGLATK
jgi:hypothetical protein